MGSRSSLAITSVLGCSPSVLYQWHFYHLVSQTKNQRRGGHHLFQLLQDTDHHRIKRLAKSTSRAYPPPVHISPSPVTTLVHLSPKSPRLSPRWFFRPSHLSPHDKQFDLLNKYHSGHVNLLISPSMFSIEFRIKVTLHLAFPLPGMCFPSYSYSLMVSFPSDLCSSIALTTLCKIATLVPFTSFILFYIICPYSIYHHPNH